MYLMYGNRDIYLTELAEDLSGPKEGGLHRRVLSDTDDYGLGFEGSHLYKIQGDIMPFYSLAEGREWTQAAGVLCGGFPDWRI